MQYTSVQKYLLNYENVHEENLHTLISHMHI